MILVTLGTQDKSFERLLVEIEHLIEIGIIQEEVVVQSGYTCYSSKKMKVFDYLPKDEFEDLIQECSCLITHGGVGTIFDGLSKGKKVIAVPRLSKYKEHGNDHQIQVVEELGREGYILPCLEVSDIQKSLKKLTKFQPKKYTGNHDKMVSMIKNYISQESGSIFSSNIFLYFLFGIFFLLFQYLCFNLSFFDHFSSIKICLLEWVVSYCFTFLIYFSIYHRSITFHKRTFVFSSLCFIFHFFCFFVGSWFLSYELSVLISSLITLFLVYVIYMLVFGGDISLTKSTVKRN